MTSHPQILLVDDDYVSMSYFVETLKELGCNVEQCFSASQAIAHLTTFGHLIDGVILDWMIPIGVELHVSGLQENLDGGNVVLNHLRERHPGIPVVIFTNAAIDSRINSDVHPICILNKFEYTPSDFSPIILKYFGINFPLQN